ncbi:hypothetical protein LTR94_038144, partial [Friedmanniomyces endolithicus]
PWRIEAAEAQLVGKAAGEEAFAAVADTILQGARSFGQNDFKPALAKNAIVQALTSAARGTDIASGSDRHPEGDRA